MWWLTNGLNINGIRLTLAKIFLQSGNKYHNHQVKESAFKLAVALERYAKACMQTVFDNRVTYNEGALTENFKNLLPIFDKQDLDTHDLQVLSCQLKSEILEF